MYIGDRLFTNAGIGEVIVLDVKKDYAVLFRVETSSFIKANHCEYNGHRLVWNSGEYYWTLDELIKSYKK